jgi:hydroxyacylglutathione hydrolase
MSDEKKYLLRTLQVGFLATNCYLLTDSGSRKTAIIDPGGEPQEIIKKIKEDGLNPVLILNTHGHADHIGANAALKKHFKIPVYIHREEAAYLTDPDKNCSTLAGENLVSDKADVLLDDKSVIELGGLTLRVIFTPGHTRGGISFLVEDLLFTGDTLFDDSVGRSDLYGGDESRLEDSVKKLLRLPPETIVLPGHGPASTLEREARENPFLKP